jgi:hypothetical protein
MKIILRNQIKLRKLNTCFTGIILFLGINTAYATEWQLNCVRDKAFSFSVNKTLKNIEYYDEHDKSSIQEIKQSKGPTEEEPRYGEWATINTNGKVTSSFGTGKANDKARPTAIWGVNTSGSNKETEWSFKFLENNPLWKLENNQEKWQVTGYSPTYHQSIDGRYTCTWEKCDSGCIMM